MRTNAFAGEGSRDNYPASLMGNLDCGCTGDDVWAGSDADLTLTAY